MEFNKNVSSGLQEAHIIHLEGREGAGNITLGWFLGR
jgi:hypothetical protein